MKNKLLVFSVLFIIMLIAISISTFGNLNKAVTVTAQGTRAGLKKAPDWTLLDMAGTEVSLSDFKGKVIILDFWATWCPPCRAEVPHFIELYNEYKDRGLEVVGISLDADVQKAVSEFVKEQDINYTVLAADGKVASLYGGIRSIPTTFVIDRQQRIVQKYVGYRDKEVFEEDIKGLL